MLQLTGIKLFWYYLNSIRITFLCVLFQVCLLITSNAQIPDFSHWTKEGQYDQLKIYTKDSTGSLKKFGAEFIVNSDVKAVLSLLRNVNNYNEWIEGIHECRLVERMSDLSYSYHFFINKKILFGLYTIKKDGFVNSVVTTRSNIMMIASNIDRSAPIESEYDRIDHYQVKWYVIPITENSVKIMYEGVVDVQINFAYSLIKPTIIDNLKGSFSNMEAVLKNSQKLSVNSH